METAGKGSVVKPLLALEREDVTGVLEFRAQGVATQIYCRGGELVFATGGTLTETLGRMLIRCGRLTEDQVAAVIRKLTDAIVDGENTKFGEILIEYGFMTTDELEIALCQQVKDKILGCVHRGDGEWRLSRNDKRLEDVGNYVVRTRPCLIEGALFLPERRVETILQLDENRYPELVAPENVVAAEFELTKGETAVLAELDGSAAMQFVLAKAPGGAMAPLVAALVLGGGVDLKASPTGSKRADGRSVPPDFRTLRRAQASVDDTATALRPPVRRPSSHALEALPDPLVAAGLPPKRPSYSTLAVVVPPSQRKSSRLMLQVPTPDAQARSREAFDRLKADLDGRKPASKRMRWPDPKDDRQRRLMAESAFHQGRMWLHAEEAERALPGLHRALELRPEDREYELYMKWAQMLVNDTFKEDGQRASIQALAAKLVRENRDCELGHSILGHCAHHDQNDEAALRFFARASMLDPKLVDAARLARLLAQRASGTGARTGSRPDIRGARRERGRLDPSIDEIVPGLATRPIFSHTRAETPPKPILPPTGPRGDEAPASHKTFDGVAPPAAVEPPRKRRDSPSVVTAIAPRPPSKPPPPLPKVAVTQQSPQMPVLQRTPSPPVPVATPAAPPPVAPMMFPPTTALPALNPAITAGMGTTPMAPPLRPSMPPMGSGPQEMRASMPPPAMQNLSQPMPPMGPGSGPQEMRASMPPPGWNVTPMPVMAHASQPNIPLAGPPSSHGSAAYETVQLPKKSKAPIVIGLILTLGVTGVLAFLVGTRVLAPKDSGASTTTATSAVTPKTPATPIQVASAPPPSATVTASSAPTPDPVITASATTVTKPTPPAPPSNKTTGVLRIKKNGAGHRVFVDGHIVGDGGKDITVACGAHRVKVGSNGKESTVDIPCGGTAELD